MSETVLEEIEIYEEDNNVNADRFFTFSRGKTAYGMEINYITKITGLKDLIKITGLHSNVKGIINFRDRIVPVIDAQVRNNKELWAYSNRACILIIEIRKNLIGIVVDNPNEVLNMDIVINYLLMMNLIKV